MRVLASASLGMVGIGIELNWINIEILKHLMSIQCGSYRKHVWQPHLNWMNKYRLYFSFSTEETGNMNAADRKFVLWSPWFGSHGVKAVFSCWKILSWAAACFLYIVNQTSLICLAKEEWRHIDGPILFHDYMGKYVQYL